MIKRVPVAFILTSICLLPLLSVITSERPAIASDPLAYDGTSFILKDGDPGDPTPREDMFAQTLQMPYGLKSITIKYQRNTINGNQDDIVWGQLWLIDEDGNLVEDVAYWDVFESSGWAMEALGAPPGVISKLSGRRAALVFLNDTDGSPPSAPAAEKEWMLFDNIILTACYDPDAVLVSAQEPPVVPERLMQEYSPAAQESFYVSAQAREEVCRNLILNSQLDVVDIGGGSFTAVPWEVLNPILYYTDGNPATPTPTHTPTETPTVTPTPTPGLPAPVIFDILNEGNRNSYDVDWSSVLWADWYRLEENRNATTWEKVYEGPVTKVNRSNMADGQYCYQVSAFNTETYSNPSSEKCTVVGRGIPLTQRGFLPFVIGE